MNKVKFLGLILAVQLIVWLILPITAYFNFDSQYWLVWDLNCLFQKLSLAIILYQILKHNIAKTIALSLTILYGLDIIYYTTSQFLSESPFWNNIVFIFFLLIIAAIVFSLIIYVLGIFKIKSDEYNPEYCYIAYLRPYNFLGYLACFFIKNPYGHCFWVINGTKLKFNRDSSLSEELYIPNENYHLKKIRQVSLDFARQKLKNQKWSIWNNCFSIFEELVDE